MTWLIVASAAQIILGASAVCDKLLLKRRISDPAVYTFWFGLLGIFSLLLLPLGAATIPISAIPLALVAGMFFIAGMLCIFFAMSTADVIGALGIVAVFSPVATFAVGRAVGRGALGYGDFFAFALLVAGAFLFFLTEKKELRTAIVWLSLGAGFCFGVANVLTKITFERADFLAGFFWPRMGGIIFALSLLLIPKIRRRIVAVSGGVRAATGVWYMANRVWGAAGSALVSVAIFLAHPALVDATQGLRYVVIFVAGWYVLHERSAGWTQALKIIATALIGLGLVSLGFASYAQGIPVDPARPIAWGVSFSQKFSRELGLDWQKNFTAIIEELQPRKIRLIAYWDDIESIRGQYDFSDIDWMLQRIRGKPIEVILALGMKTPRWPECHVPNWVRALSAEEREEVLRGYVEATVSRYRANPTIKIWQLENEPFFRFGTGCESRPADFFEKEIGLVRSLDASRPVLVTDAGEFGSWYRAAHAGDIFGSSLYREVYSPSWGWLVGVIHYPFEPSFFRLKQKIVRRLVKEPEKKFIVAELQAEPWGKAGIAELSYEEQTQLFSPAYFDETIRFARNAGFDDYYLWGAEWWFSLKEKYGDDRFLERAKELLHP